MNGAKLTAAFNDAKKYAITVSIKIANGAVVQNIGLRNFQLTDCAFNGIRISPGRSSWNVSAMAHGSAAF